MTGTRHQWTPRVSRANAAPTEPISSRGAATPSRSAAGSSNNLKPRLRTPSTSCGLIPSAIAAMCPNVGDIRRGRWTIALQTTPAA